MCRMEGRPLRTVVGLAVGAVVVVALAGCSFNPDPTESSFYVKVVNDTSRTVVLSTCGTADFGCTKAFETGKVAPGESWPTVQTTVGQIDPVLVEDVGGRRLGCLPLYFSYNATGATVRVSTAVPCRLSAYRERAKAG